MYFGLDMDCTRSYFGCMHSCYIHEKLFIFVYNGLNFDGCTWFCWHMHQNIYYIKNAPTPKAFEYSSFCFAPLPLPSNLGQIVQTVVVNIRASNEHLSVDVFTSLDQHGITDNKRKNRTFYQHSHSNIMSIWFRTKKHGRDGYNLKPVIMIWKLKIFKSTIIQQSASTVRDFFLN